jgi:uncharacterized protein
MSASDYANRPSGRPHLGVGWSFPVRPEGGRLRYASYEEDIEQAIGIILETARRERVMLPGFGAGLHDFVFRSNVPATQRAVENEVKQALRDWEPRITVERVRAQASPEKLNLLLIEIDYVVRRSNAAVNRVYPFYLSEGT